MILYLTSPHPHLPTTATQCYMRVCRSHGFGENHLCFATEPLAGLGEHVYQIDVPQEVVEKYEYENEFRTEKARYFALPLRVLQDVEVRHDTYEALTGRRWNFWTVTVLDRHKVVRSPRLKGKWAIVWTSRDGIATARVHRRQEGPDRQNVFLSVEIETTKEFDPTSDYIVAEYHEETTQTWTDQRVKETWRLQTLAGVCPQWVIYPSAWKKWAWDKRVERSAIEYILQHVPEVAPDVRLAESREDKESKMRLWRTVASRAGAVLSNRLNTPVDLGKLASHSWTAINAMPMRIAKRISTHLPYAEWAPPWPQPEYADPNQSGRKALANLYGAYPREGPGVDHAPQDRPYIGREGELNNSGDFNVRQGGKAGALAP